MFGQAAEAMQIVVFIDRSSREQAVINANHAYCLPIATDLNWKDHTLQG